jgi:hypothetical protein
MIPETGTFATISLQGERQPVEEIDTSLLDSSVGSPHLHRDSNLLYMRVMNDRFLIGTASHLPSAP